MNPLRDRVLTNSGFSATPEDSTLPTEQELARLKQMLNKVTKKLNDANKNFEGTRSVELIKLKDSVMHLKRANDEYRHTNDKLMVKMAKLEGVNDQLGKELKEALDVSPVVRRKVSKKN